MVVENCLKAFIPYAQMAGCPAICCVIKKRRVFSQ